MSHYTTTSKFEVTVGEYTLTIYPDGLPGIYQYFREHAQLTVSFKLDKPYDSVAACFLAVRKHREWPFLVVAQEYETEVFSPGALIVLETSLLFVGAGSRLLAYKLDRLERLWEDKADIGFLNWARYGDYVVMSGELELTVWDINGQKQWSTFVEPPWDYSVQNGMVSLDVMGRKSSFSLTMGPQGPQTH